MNITLELANEVIAAVQWRAQYEGIAVACAVVDTGGNLVAFGRMDGANLITIDTAIGKAFTAISIGADTVGLSAAIQPGAPLFGTGLTLAGSRSFVPYAGGLLLRSGDEVIGALGVSGAASSEVDHEIGAPSAQLP
ncbi:heme-binding protein [Nocardia tengchongensis]|uniref:GlcG/HbpS family heme-binding protein n=1 Tax=Nocardia tengchongensis TaxID=2055889 RepID=UPI003678DB8F